MGAFSAWRQRTFNVRGHLVGVFEIIPNNPTSPSPVVICPGWVEVPESWLWHAERMAELGRRVIAYDLPHGLPFTRNGTNLGEYAIELEKMETLVAVMQALEVDRADLIGRSEGAIWALLTALYYPHMVRNIVLQNPAGLIGKDRLFPFLIRWLRDKKQTVWNETGDPKPYAPISAWSVMARQGLKTAQEILAIMHTDSRHALRMVAASGIKVGVVTTDEDQLFPVKRIRKNTAGLTDAFIELRGGHTSFFCRAEEFAEAIVRILESLERRDADGQNERRST